MIVLHNGVVTGFFMTGTTAGPWQERWRQLKLAHCAVPEYGNNRQFWESKKNVQTVYVKGWEKTGI